MKINWFAVLGDQVPKRKGAKCAADIAILRQDIQESGGGGDDVNNPIAVLISELPLLVIEYKPKLYSLLDKVEINHPTELCIQAYYIKHGFGLESCIQCSITVRRSVEEYNVPKSTLCESVVKFTLVKSVALRNILTDDEDDDIASFLNKCASISYAQSWKQVIV